MAVQKIVIAPGKSVEEVMTEKGPLDKVVHVTLLERVLRLEQGLEQQSKKHDEQMAEQSKKHDEQMAEQSKKLATVGEVFKPLAERTAVEDLLPHINKLLGAAVRGRKPPIHSLLAPLVGIKADGPQDHVEFILALGDLYVGTAVERAKTPEEQDFSNVADFKAALERVVKDGNDRVHKSEGRALITATQATIPGFKWPLIVQLLMDTKDLGMKAMCDRAARIGCTAGAKRPRGRSEDKKRARTSEEADPAGQSCTFSFVLAQAPAPAPAGQTFTRQASQSATPARQVTLAGRSRNRAKRRRRRQQ